MITDLDRIQCPSVRLGGVPMALLKDPETGLIEVVAAVVDTGVVREKAQELVASQLIEGREFLVSQPLQLILGLGFVYCSREYADAYEQELRSALKQGCLIQRVLKGVKPVCVTCNDTGWHVYGACDRKVECADCSMGVAGL